MQPETPPSDLGLERFRDYLCLLARSHLHPRHHRRLDPSDVAQQTLLDAHEKRAQFRGATDAETAQWLRQILVHNIADAIRAMGAAKRDISREQSLEATIERSFSSAHQWLAANQSSPSGQIAKIEELLALAHAIAELPDRQRDAVVLHHLQGLSVAELAIHLACTEGAAGAHLYRGLKQLRTLMSVS
jgi:RNA polymerase sigma-70 factor (ECF subfamily)